MTSSITSPGVLPPTDQDPQRPTLDSLVDVWVDSIRHGEDREAAVAGVVADLWRWAS